MPDAGASRKRQIEVTPGPFSEATASGAVRALIAQVYEGFFEDFAIPARRNRRGLSRGDSIRPCLGKAVSGYLVPALLESHRSAAPVRRLRIRFDHTWPGTVRLWDIRSSVP
jgi:hypothetical protein